MIYNHYVSAEALIDTFGFGIKFKLGSTLLEKATHGHPLTMVKVGHFWGIQVLFFIFEFKLGIKISEA